MRGVNSPLRLLAVPLFASAALSGCAPDDETKDRTPPIGFELAIASQERSSQADELVIDISSDELSAMVANGEVRLIDIREADELAAGMIQGARHIPMDELTADDLAINSEIPTVLYCRSGRRTRIAATQLAAQTGAPIAHLEHGLVGWRQAGNSVSLP